MRRVVKITHLDSSDAMMSNNPRTMSRMDILLWL